MAESSLAFALQHLSNLIAKEHALLGGLEGELREIRDELNSIRAILKDAESKENMGNSDFELQEWVKQVQEVAYDIEDVVDDFLLCSTPHHRPSGMRRRVQNLYASFKNYRPRRRVASMIMEIKGRVQRISDRHQRYTINVGSGQISQHPTRGHALLVEEAELVGIDEPKRKIISQLLDETSHLKVVSVVGMGGLGKTTLVKRIYEAVEVRRAFSAHAWLNISQSFQIGECLKKLIQQLFTEVKEEPPVQVIFMDEDELRAFVKSFLKERSYIIVIDDVWRSEDWDLIKYAFPDDNCSSRVILTTRNAEIATSSSREAHGYVHKMEPLSDEDSWTLFCRKTFLGSSCPPDLVDICRSILRKCEGLPLAILAISGVLALKDTSKLYEWEMVFRSLSGELVGTGRLDRIRKILLLSYDELPYYLKSCLLYIGIFPEDSLIHTWRLTRLWVAEGFVQERPGMTMLDAAQNYLNELINRSLVQLAGTYPDKPIDCCRVHNLFHELILSKGRENNILTVSSTTNSRWPENVRRLVIHKFTYPQEPTRCFYLRSLIINSYTDPLPSSILRRILNRGPKRLKVLDIRGSTVKNIPKEVFKLLHLSFLNLAGTKVATIPKSIGKLQNLEFFCLAGTKVEELPANIRNLKKLRELYVHEFVDDQHKLQSGFKAPEGIGGLVSLERLNYVQGNNEKTIIEVGRLKQLRLLGITKLKTENGRALLGSIEKLAHLHELHIYAITPDEIIDLEYPISTTPQFLRELDLSGRLVKVPHWLPLLRSLTALRLWDSCLKEDVLEYLQDLPNLERLILRRAYEEDSLFFKANKFQNLKHLDLITLRGLRSVLVEKGAMPCLEYLYVDDCRLLEELPQGIQYLSKLQRLWLIDTGSKLESDLKNLHHGSDDFLRISHIPDIYAGSTSNGKLEGFMV